MGGGGERREGGRDPEAWRRGGQAGTSWPEKGLDEAALRCLVLWVAHRAPGSFQGSEPPTS